MLRVRQQLFEAGDPAVWEKYLKGKNESDTDWSVRYHAWASNTLLDDIEKFCRNVWTSPLLFQQRSGKKLYQPPGSRLLRLAEFLCSRKTYEEVLEPAIIDLREEYHQALSAGRTWKAKWVLVRGYWSFFNAAGLMSLVRIAKSIVKIWKLIP
jgi:hypothetical protein